MASIMLPRPPPRVKQIIVAKAGDSRMVKQPWLLGCPSVVSGAGDSPEGASHQNPGQRPGLSAEPEAEALKGRCSWSDLTLGAPLQGLEPICGWPQDPVGVAQG
jgi:hypothetical protein